MNRPLLVAALCVAPLCQLPAQIALSQPADAFIDSVGVNVHLTYDDTAYSRFAELVKPKLQSLGIRHIRDSANGYSLPAAQIQKINELFSSLGIRTTLIIPRREALASALAQVGPALAAVEGPNEPDLIGAGLYTNAELIALQALIYADVKSYNPMLAVMPPSFTTRGAAASFGAQPADAGNVHPYPGGNNVVDTSLDWNQLTAERTAPSPKLFQATETGYYTRPDYVQGISLAAHGKYLPRLFLEYFRRGVQRTFAYELLDEYSATNTLLQGGQESHFGLVKLSGVGDGAAFSDKPGFLAVKAMLALLKDSQSAGYSQGALDFRLRGGNKDVRHLLLRKGDGSFWLVIWQNARNYDPQLQADLSGPTQNLTLEFLQTVGSVTVYEPKPSNGFSATAQVLSSSAPASVVLPLGDYPLYCRIGASSAPLTAPVLSSARQGAGDAMLASDGTFAQVTGIAYNYADSRIGDESATAGGYRSVVKFALPGAPAGKVVSTARLSFRYLAKAGSPNHSVEAAGYVPLNDFVTAGDWNCAASTLGTVITPQTTPGPVALQNTAVRDLLRNAYASGKNCVAMRLQLADGATATGGAAYDFYQVATSRHSDPAWRPVLEITWQDATTLTAPVAQPNHNGTIVASAPFTTGTAIWPQYVDARVGDENPQRAYRAVYCFTLPALPAGHSVQGAFVRLQRFNALGKPTHVAKAFAVASAVTAIDPTQWPIPSGAEDLGPAGAPFTSGQAEIRIAVTQVVRQAYANGQAAVRMHLALDGTSGATGGSAYDFYDFATSGHSNAAYRPRIEIQVTPQ